MRESDRSRQFATHNDPKATVIAPHGRDRYAGDRRGLTERELLDASTIRRPHRGAVRGEEIDEAGNRQRRRGRRRDRRDGVLSADGHDR